VHRSGLDLEVDGAIGLDPAEALADAAEVYGRR